MPQFEARMCQPLRGKSTARRVPAPKEEDLSKGVLEVIDMDSYRVEAQAFLKMSIAAADAFTK